MKNDKGKREGKGGGCLLEKRRYDEGGCSLEVAVRSWGAASLCVSLSLAGFFKRFVSAAFRTGFNHQLPQLSFPHCARHNIAAAREVDTPQGSLAFIQEETLNLRNIAQW